MLKCDNLHVQRGGKTILTGIDLTLQDGEVLAVLGPNGAGKSTLLAALSGELLPSFGHVLFADKPLAAWLGSERAQRLAVLPQQSSLNFAFVVDEVVGLGRLPHASGRQRDSEIIGLALEAADAAHLRGRNYVELSGGERQRVHLARVLAQLWPGQGGQALLLDEPTSMLDPLHQLATLKAVRSFAGQGAGVLVILHDLNLAARFADRIALLHQGGLHAIGTPDEVLTEANLQTVFNLPVIMRRHPELGCPWVIPR